MSKRKNSFLSHLLPYDLHKKVNGSILTALKEYQSLLRAFFEATHHLQKNNLDKFDPLVGENACEIRAIAIAKIGLKHRIDLNFINSQIISALRKIDALLEPASINALMRSDETLIHIFEKNDLDIPLAKEESFLLQCFLLSEMKTVNDTPSHSLYRSEIAEPKNFLHFGDISLSFARSLLSKLRQSIASSSVQFVRDTTTDPTLAKMLSEEYTLTHNALQCLPMFWTYKTLLLTALKENIPLILHAKFLSEDHTLIDEEVLFFKPINNTFVLSSPDLATPACVIQGAVVNTSLTKKQWIAKIQQTTPIDVILSGAADHRQFPDPSHDRLFDHISEYHNYKALAQKEGYSSNNPATFFIQHVYASTPKHLFSKLSEEKVAFTHKQGFTSNVHLLHALQQIAHMPKFNTEALV